MDEKYVRWSLIAHINLLEEIIKRLRENGVEIYVERITNIGSHDESSTLTFNQEHILKLAWRLGFFDFPRKLILQKLSKMLRLSQATVIEILRAGLKKIISSYFTEKHEKGGHKKK